MIFDETFSKREEMRFVYDIHDGKKCVIENLAPFLKGKKVLDWGCGNGYYTKMLASSALSVTGYDFPEILANARQINPSKNITYTDTLEKYYDIIVCNDSLEFNTDWKEKLNELKTMCNTLYVIAPNFDMYSTPWVLQKLAGLYSRFFDRKRRAAQRQIDSLESMGGGHDKYVTDFAIPYGKKYYFFLQTNPVLSLLEETYFCNHILYTL